MTNKGSIAGVKVLDLSRMLPGPYCSMILADHGADVIAIDRVETNNDGLFFLALNRNKRHMTLNLKSKEGIDIFNKLAADADVIIEGFRPGVVQRLGIDYEAIRKENPNIIYCSISGYGQSGSRRKEAGHDVNYISTAGVLGLIAEQNKPPVIPGIQIADVAGGSMNAVIGILLALYARNNLGKGQYIDISMTDGVLGMLTLANHFSELSEKPPEASNSLLSHRFACYNTYETKDGRYVSLGAVENKFWKKLCGHFDRLDLISLQYDEAKNQDIITIFRDLFLTKTYQEWVEELEPLEVCFSGIKNLSEVFDDKTFKDRGMILDYVDDSGKNKKSFGIPVKLSETPGKIKANPARFGADTEDILLELGFTKDRIGELLSTGVV
jgi:crotonobetainyl-CoA:carnitine CoA-transferase CaiB-like acyl-CoA transferase